MWGQVDEKLERRVAALSVAVRGSPHPDFGPGGPGLDDGPRRPPEGRHERRPGRREVRLTSDVLGLFDENHSDGFYYFI